MVAGAADVPRMLSTALRAPEPTPSTGAIMGDMPVDPTSGVRYLAPAQVAELLSISVDEVVALVQEGRLRGARLGSPARWRVEEASVADYVDDQVEEARRMALWNESNAASFPEVWGSRTARGD
jgi:excisionase family DNA binding protein